jgi:hypothetical protein
MGDCSLLGEDVFRALGATVTPSGTAVDEDRLRDQRDDEQASQDLTSPWVTSVDLGVGVSAACDAVAVLNSNLDQISATVSVYRSSDGIAWTLAHSFAGSKRDHYRPFTTPGAFRYWRVTISGTGTALVGEIMLGRRVVFPDPPRWQGLDPYSERPVAYSKVTVLPLTQHTVAYVEREISVAWTLLHESFLEAVGTPADFRTWWEAYGSMGEPLVFAIDEATTYEDVLFYGRLAKEISRPFVTPPDSHYTMWPPDDEPNAYRGLVMTIASRRRG